LRKPLDGLNEITADITPLLIDLNEWSRMAKSCGIQLIVSTRFPSNHQFAVDFNIWELAPLSSSAVSQYLGTDNATRSNTLNELLANPMMLNLYQKLSESDMVQGEVRGIGELLWQYMALKLEAFEKEQLSNPEAYIRNHFFLQHLMPYLAYQMEQKEQLVLEEKDVEIIVNEAFQRFYESDFLLSSGLNHTPIKRYRKYVHALQLGTLPLIDAISRFEELMEDFQQALYPITREGVHLRFFHQSFQDFFAAKHLLNEINLALEKERLPTVLKDRRLPANLQKMLGEIVGEHRNRPALVPAGRKWAQYYIKTSLAKILDLCRGITDKKIVGYTIWNILSIWKQTRQTFAGADLSNLNLTGFDFNGTKHIELTKDGEKITSRWDNSCLSPSQWFPQGHSKEVNKISISPDGKYLATASNDHTIKLWLVETNEFVRTLHNHYGHFSGVTTMAFSPDSQRLITGASDSGLIEWEVATGKTLHVFRGHQAAISAVAYHPKEEKMLSAAADGTVREWCTQEGKKLKAYSISTQLLTGFKIESVFKAMEIEAKKLGTDYTKTNLQKHIKNYLKKMETEVAAIATYTKPKTTIVKEEGNKIEQFVTTCLDSYFKEINTVDYTKQGQSFLVGSQGVILELSTRTGKKIASFYQENVIALAQNPSGKKMIALSKERTAASWQIKEWAIETEKITQSFIFNQAPKFNRNAQFADITYSPTGKYVLVAGLDDNIYEWPVKEITKNTTAEIKTTQLFKGHPRRVTSIAYHPNGQSFYSGSFDGTSKKWSTLNGQVLHTFSCSASPYNTLINIPNSDWILASSENGTFHRWNTMEQKRDLIFAGEGAAYSMAIYSPKGVPTLLVTGGEWGIIQVWTLAGKCIRRFTEHSTTVTSIAINQVTGAVVSGDDGGHTLLWSLKITTLLATYPKASNSITAIVFSPKLTDSQFVTCCKNGLINLWSAEETDGDSSKQVFNQNNPTRVYTMDFDGRYILVGKIDGTIEEWDSQTGQLSFSVQLNAERILYITYSPDKKHILIGGQRQNKLYELPIKEKGATRQIDLNDKVVYEGHTSYILSAIYDKAQATFFSVSQDCTLRQWNRTTQKELWGIQNVPGFMVADLDFRTVRWSPPLTNQEHDLLHQYKVIPC